MDTQSDVSEKKMVTCLLLIFFLGFVGAHRFYVGKPATAVLFLFTGGGFLVWFIIDLIHICTGSFTDHDGKRLDRS